MSLKAMNLAPLTVITFIAQFVWLGAASSHGAVKIAGGRGGSAAWGSSESRRSLVMRGITPRNDSAAILLSCPDAVLPLLLAAGLLGNGAAAGGGALPGRRLSSRSSDCSRFDTFYAVTCGLPQLDSKGTYETYYEIDSGNDPSIFKKLCIKVDEHLGAVVKGEVTARKYGRDGVASYVPAKFNLKIRCDSTNRYKYQGEDSYLSVDEAALAISNLDTPGVKCTIDKSNVEGTIWIDGYEVVGMLAQAKHFFARTKRVKSERLTLYKF